MKPNFEIFIVDNYAKILSDLCKFYTDHFPAFPTGNIKAPIRNLTIPQIVKITCSYFWGFNLNLSWATRNILTVLIRCSTKIRRAENALFCSFCSVVNSRFLGFLMGVVIKSSPT